MHVKAMVLIWSTAFVERISTIGSSETERDVARFPRTQLWETAYQ